jgi:hypothetical protein
LFLVLRLLIRTVTLLVTPRVSSLRGATLVLRLLAF